MSSAATEFETQYYAGLDLGKVRDYTAFALFERTRSLPPKSGVQVVDDGPMGKTTIIHTVQSATQKLVAKLWHYRLVMLKRWDVGTSYEAIAEFMALAYSKPVEKRGLMNTTLAIDRTGVGVAVCEMVSRAMRHKGGRCRALQINIGGGSKVTEIADGRRYVGWNVPKKELVSVLQVLMGTRRLKVDPGLDNSAALVKEFQNFKVKVNSETANESFECLVGGTLVETDKGKVKIEDVRAGDKVLTRIGYSRVLWAGQTKRVHETCSVSTEAGTIEGTPDHLVWSVNRGWVPLGELTCRDLLIQIPTTGARASTQKSSSSMALNTASCRPTLTISTSIQRMLSTEQCGNTSWERYPKGMTFTMLTKTKTLRIMTSTILSASLTLNTLKSISACADLLRLGRAKIAISRSQSVEASMISGRLSARSVADLLAGHLRSTYASSAGSSSRQSERRTAQSNSAPILANPETGTSAGTQKGHAPGVESYSNQRADSANTAHVLVPPRTIDWRDAVPVYDIVVEGQHEFFANGVLVHNSWRESDHDDMVLACALALWVAERASKQMWVA